MKRSIFGFMFAALLSLSVVARATTTDELIITSGGLTATIADNSNPVTGCVGTGCAALSGDLSGAAGTDEVTGSINSWIISISTGSSKSPNTTPYGLDLLSLTASCSAGTCDTLDIQFTDINFDIPGTFVSPITSNISVTGPGTGSTTESAYVSSSNTLGAETTLIGTQTFSTLGSASATVSGGSAGGGNYSLTLDESFTGSNGVSFNDTGMITTAVPESWNLSSSLGMLGFGVVAVIVARRRGLVKTTV